MTLLVAMTPEQSWMVIVAVLLVAIALSMWTARRFGPERTPQAARGGEGAPYHPEGDKHPAELWAHECERSARWSKARRRV